MSKPTNHGEMIAEQIQGEDAYGYSGELTIADIWLILDNIHSSFVETENDTILCMLSGWMTTLELMDDDLPL